ncbi:MAG: HEAT repeat domain-containing protein [Polyangiaceae bacterium]
MARLALRMVLAALIAVSIPLPALADSRVQFLADRLRYPPAPGQADDFRVRANAALALAATNDDGAVSPLCGGLDDPNDAVRQAAAAGLKKLGRPAAVDCLKRRLGVETSDGVKQQIQRAIDALGSGGGGAPAFVPGAKYYVSVSGVTNNTGRSDAEVQRIVGGAVRSKLSQLGEYQQAPAGESTSDAKAAIAKRSLKGFYLSLSVEKFDYSDGNLHVRVKITVFSYPGKDLRGEVPSGATLPGARPGDTASEDQLMGVVAARAAELFSQNFR